jgi:hypothetical protein
MSAKPPGSVRRGPELCEGRGGRPGPGEQGWGPRRLRRWGGAARPVVIDVEGMR